MAEMKNICGKIPMDLHEKVREEIELTESSTQKFLQQVIEEHFNRVEGKGEISMGAVRTVAVQVSEELFQRLKTVIGKKRHETERLLNSDHRRGTGKRRMAENGRTKTAWKKLNLQPENLKKKRLNRTRKPNRTRKLNRKKKPKQKNQQNGNKQIQRNERAV